MPSPDLLRFFSFVAISLTTLVPLSAAEPVSIGDAAPDFKILSLEGEQISLEHFSDAKVVVICFTSNGCPVAKSYEARLRKFALDYKVKGVELVAINCDFKEVTGGVAQQIESKLLGYTYALDESGKSARDYGAQVTPQLFVLDEERKLSYMGPFDDDMHEPKIKFVCDAVDAVLSGDTPSVTSKRPFGCRIKLKRR